MRQIKLFILSGLACVAFLVGVGLVFRNLIAKEKANPKSVASSSHSVPSVLGVQFPDEILTINVPSEFTQDVIIRGKLALAGLLGGTGIKVDMSGDEPKLYNTGILTLNELTGNLEIVGSSGISVSSTDTGILVNLNQITTSNIADQAVTLSKIAHSDCSSNQVLQYTGSEWECGDLPEAGTTDTTDYTVTADNGLTKEGSNITWGGALTDDTEITLGTSFLSFLNGSGLGLKIDSTGLTTATGPLSVDGLFDVAGHTTLSSLETTSTATVAGTLKVDGATDLNSTLDVSGDTTLNSALTVTGTATISGNTLIGGNLTVQGAGIASFAGGLEFNGALKPGGLAGDSGYSLVSQGDGLSPVWTDLSSLGSLGAWNLVGNNLTPDSANYNVGIGTTDPQAKFDVYGDLKLTRLDSTVVGTAVQNAWTLNSNPFNYRRSLTITNGDGANTLPANYEATVTISGAEAAKIYADTRSDQTDFRVAYNSTEIARIITSFTASTISFKFQLQSTISPSGSSTSYYAYYSNPTITSIPTQYSTYVGDAQLDSLDTIADWVSSDPVQLPISHEATTLSEGTGSIKGIATVDNIGVFSSTSQGQLPATRTGFGFAPFTVGSTKYVYEVGGSSDGTAGNAQTSIHYAALNSTTGDLGSFSTNVNSLPAATLDNSVSLATPPIDSGTGADGTLDLSQGSAGCTGSGLIWTSATSTCTVIAGMPAYESSPAVGLNTRIGGGGHSFIIPSGPHIGKIFIVNGTTTSIFDPATNSLSAGPELGAIASTGANSFTIVSGTNSGKILTILANNALTKLYDPSANTYEAGPSLTASAGYGSHTYSITSGIHSGKIMIILGNNTKTTNIYDPADNTFIAGPSMISNSSAGTHSFQIPSGPQSGKFLTVHTGTTSSLYNPADNTVSAGPTVSSVGSGAGSTSFTIPTGPHAGKILTLVGSLDNGSTRLYDPATHTYVAGPAMTSSASVYVGSHVFPITSGPQTGKFMFVLGFTSSSGTTLTNIYDPSTHTISQGPNTIIYGSSNYGGHSIEIPSGSNAGKVITFSGGEPYSQLYDPATNSFGTSPIANNNTYKGSHSFTIPSGTHAGKILMITGNNSTTSKIYDPATNTFDTGPDIGGEINYGSHSFVIPSGSQVGKILTIPGSGNIASTITRIYDPANNTYSAGPDMGIPSNTTSHSFVIPSGSQAGKVLTVLANYTQSTRIYDPATNTYSAGPSTGANVYDGAHSFTIPSGSNAGKIITVMGGSLTSTKLYDPATNTYSAGPDLGIGANAGGNSFVIPSGPQQGKILVLIGNGEIATRLYDPSTNTFSTGPSLAQGLNYGGHSISITSGPNAGKVFVILGNTQTYTSIYNPATHSFSIGTSLSTGVGYGGHSFIIPSGPQSGKALNIVGNYVTNTQLINFGKTEFNFSSINIPSGTILTSNGPTTSSNFITMKSTGAVSVAGDISLAGKGYAPTITTYTAGNGPGYGSAGLSSSKGGGGGSYGGAGGTGGNGLGGGIYTTDDSGSSGGTGSSGGSASYSSGGGGIKISSGGNITVTASGWINTNGATGYPHTYAAGGGSGGRIYLQGNNVTISGFLNANGGVGGNGTSSGGGGGGGGRITIEALGTLDTTGSTITAALGAKGTGGTSAVAGTIGTQSTAQISPSIYVFGGKNTSGSATSNIYQGLVSPTDGSIGSLTTSSVSLPQNLFGHSSTTLSLNSINYAYVIGGNNDSADQTTVYKGVFTSSDIASFTTTAQAQLPTGLSYHALASASISGTNYLYIVGGKSSGTAQNTIYKATINSSTGNIDTLTATAQAVLPQALYSAGAFVATVGANNYLYVIGGNNGSSNQTTVYKALLDASGNVTPGSFTTVGQNQLSSGISGHSVFNYTDASSNQYAYLLGGTTTSPQTMVMKTLYSPINQTAYNLSKTISVADLSNKGAITFDVYSSRTGAYTAFEIYNGSTWQSCTDNVHFSSGVFTVNVANTWETKTCSIADVSSKSTITGLRFRVTSSSSSPWTAYFDNITARLTEYNGVAASSSGSGATLGLADLMINAQGTGMVKLNYDPTNSQAGTGGLALYDGGSTPLFVVTPTGKVGIGTASPEESLDIVGNVRITGSYYVNSTSLTVPDYVFEPTYGLMTLTDLQAYVNENGHLPDFPDQTDIEGWAALSLESREMKLLKQVEDIVLYLFDLDERVTALESTSSGTITIPAGQTDYQVYFETTYDKTPFILISPAQSNSRYILSNVTKNGFTLQTDFSDTEDKIFDWMAISTPKK